MKNRAFWLVTIAAVFVLFLVPFGCNQDDDGGDDDSDPVVSYGEDIQGTFPVDMEIEDDTCDPDNIGIVENWVIEIEQTPSLANATVSWMEAGIGAENYELFQAKVYGTVVMDADIIEEPIGNSNCVKFTARNYYIKVDAETGTLTGQLSDDRFYQGAGCDNSSLDCRQVRVLSPKAE